MDTIPRALSKSEAHARVRCKGDEHKLSSIKNELDRVRNTESRSLGIHRNRFVVDRRRSLGNVYISEMDGTQPRRRIRRPRRESAPEVISIFRRQEDRRASVKVIEKAMSEDVMHRLERTYQAALVRNGSDVDNDEDGSDVEEEDDWEIDAEVLWAPNMDIKGPDYELGRADDKKAKGIKKEKARGDIAASDQRNSQAEDKSASTNQHTPKQTYGYKRQTRHSYLDQDDCNATSDSASRDVIPRPFDVTKQTPSSMQTKQIPRRKRSHSDGNIFLNIMENRDIYPYAFTKTGVRSKEDSSEDEAQTSFRQTTFVIDDNESSDSQSSSSSSENEISGGNSDVNYSPPRTWRRAGKVSFHLSPSDVTPLPRHQGDVKLPQHDVIQSPKLYHRRGGSFPCTDEVRLSPSLKRRLAKVDLASPRHQHETQTDVSSSPSMMRRRGDDVSYAWPQTTRHDVNSDRDSSPALRGSKKGDKPKRIYQQGEAGKQISKRRPLRRSRSESVDISAMVTTKRESQHFIRVARRGSDSLQGLTKTPIDRNAPQVWNSLMFGLALSQEEREDIARHKRKELVTSLRKRQQEVDGDVSRRIRTFLQRYDDV